MRTTSGPRPIIAIEVAAGREVEVFRIVRSAVEDDPVLVNSFRSNYELGNEPRKVERSSTVIHMGISMYLSRDVAVGTARRFRRLGGYVARVLLAPGHGFDYSHTAQPLHLTVWGDPLKLSAAVLDIASVDG